MKVIRVVVLGGLLGAAALRVQAANWQASVGASQLRWDQFHAQPHSRTPGPLIAVGYKLRPYLLLELEATQAKVSFRGFRAPSGNLQTSILSLSLKPRLNLSRKATGFLGLGVTRAKNDRPIAAADTGVGIGFGIEYALAHRVFVSVEGRYMRWSRPYAAEIQNPNLFFATNVGIAF